MSKYFGYLEESTDTVKSRNQLSKLILISIYVGIWAVSLISFWWFPSGQDAMGYSIMFLWVLLPTATFISSLLIGKIITGGHGSGAPPLRLALCICLQNMQHSAQLIWWHFIKSICRSLN